MEGERKIINNTEYIFSEKIMLDKFKGLSVYKKNNEKSNEKIVYVYIEDDADIKNILQNNALTEFVKKCISKKTKLYFNDELLTTKNLPYILKIILEFNKKENEEAEDYQYISPELEEKLIDSIINKLELIENDNIEENNLKILNEIIKLFEDNKYNINDYTENIIKKISNFIISSFNDEIFDKINTKNKRDLIFNLKKSLNNIEQGIKNKFQEATGKIEDFIKKYKDKLCENLPKKLINDKIIEILPEQSEIKINLDKISKDFESLSNENIETIEGFEFEIPAINNDNIVNALIIFRGIINFNNDKIKKVKENIGSLLNDENCRQKVKDFIENLLKNKKNEQVTIELVINLIKSFPEKGEEILLNLEKESRTEILKLLSNNNEKVSFNKPELQGEYEKVEQETKLDAEIEKLKKEECYRSFDNEANREKIKSIKKLFELFRELLNKDLIDCKKVKEILGDTFNKENNNKFDVLSGKIKNLLSGVKKFRRARDILEKEEKRLKELANELSEYKGLYDRYRATSFFSRERKKLKKEMDEIYKNFKQKADFHQKYQRGRLHNFHHGILGRIATYKYMKSALKTVQKDLDRVKKGKVKISINALLEDNKDEEKVIDRKLYKFNKFVNTISKKKGITINK